MLLLPQSIYRPPPDPDFRRHGAGSRHSVHRGRVYPKSDSYPGPESRQRPNPSFGEPSAHLQYQMDIRATDKNHDSEDDEYGKQEQPPSFKYDFGRGAPVSGSKTSHFSPVSQEGNMYVRYAQPAKVKVERSYRRQSLGSNYEGVWTQVRSSKPLSGVSRRKSGGYWEEVHVRLGKYRS